MKDSKLTVLSLLLSTINDQYREVSILEHRTRPSNVKQVEYVVYFNTTLLTVKSYGKGMDVGHVEIGSSINPNTYTKKQAENICKHVKNGSDEKPIYDTLNNYCLKQMESLELQRRNILSEIKSHKLVVVDSTTISSFDINHFDQIKPQIKNCSGSRLEKYSKDNPNHRYVVIDDEELSDVVLRFHHREGHFLVFTNQFDQHITINRGTIKSIRILIFNPSKVN